MGRNVIFNGSVKKLPKPNTTRPSELKERVGYMYQITKITDREGNELAERRYGLKVGLECNLSFKDLFVGKPVTLYTEKTEAHTSPLVDYNFKDNQFIIKTENSLYYFQKLS